MNYSHFSFFKSGDLKKSNDLTDSVLLLVNSQAR